MNLAMEQTEEYVDGQLKNKYGPPHPFSFTALLSPLILSTHT